jgi:ribonuclease VapC
MSRRVVLDSSAILAIVFGERGKERTAELVEGGLISTVNLSEAAAKMTDRGFTPEAAEAFLRDLGMVWDVFGEAEALAAGWLRAVTRAAGLSLGDRACLALARREALPVVTADRAWQKVDLGVEVELIR